MKWVKSLQMSQGISIITAIHNCLPMNQFYWEALNQNTLTPFELIIIDNNSTDGSESFFQELSKSKTTNPIKYIRNSKNQSYPLSQIQGMEQSSHDIMVFLNNDTWMPRGWHIPFEKELTENPLLVLSPSGQEAQPTQQMSDQLKRRWKHIQFFSQVWKKVFFKSELERLSKSLRWMYGDPNQFQTPTPFQSPGYFHGIKGDCVAFHRRLLSVLSNPWDPRIEAADWHLYLTLASLHEQNSEIPLPRVLLDSYVHHFGRYSAKRKKESFETGDKFLCIDSVWNPETIKRLWWGYHLPHH